MNKEQYQEYLKSEIWKHKRFSVLSRDKYRCVKCKSNDNLEIHHLTYKNIYNEPNEDLITLCKKCHQMEHSKNWIKNLNDNDFYRSFVYKNKITNLYYVAEYDDRKMRIVDLAEEFVKDGLKNFALHDYKGVILYSENIDEYIKTKYKSGNIELSDFDNVSYDLHWNYEDIKYIADRDILRG